MARNCQWIVQRNLTNQNDFTAFQTACLELGIRFTGVDIIPFTHVLPPFDRSVPGIFYGSTTFHQLAYADHDLAKGVFFDPVRFSMQRYIHEWGKHMLNHDAVVTDLDGLLAIDHDADELLFIRPDDDGKSFAGEVMRFGDCDDWVAGLKQEWAADVYQSVRIVVGKPYNIGREWRLWCVNKKVIAASQYRNKFILDKQRGCPDSVIEFSEELCRSYTPHDIFVMDVCECGGELYVVECNCMNAAGFYHADIEKIVDKVSACFEEIIHR